MDNKNSYLVLGKSKATQVIFKIVFSLGLDETLKIIQRRISGASADVQRDFLWTFHGQLPQKEQKKIHHYTLVKLGSGGFGTVWKSVDIYSGDIVAVKEFVPWWTSDSLDREIDALSRFQHVSFLATPLTAKLTVVPLSHLSYPFMAGMPTPEVEAKGAMKCSCL